MAIEGMYQDVENTSSPVRRRASARRPLGSLNANNIMSPSTQKYGVKAVEKTAPPAPANEIAAPVFSIDPEVSPWTVPDSPVRCPLDEKEVAKKRWSSGALVMPALAIGSVLALLAAPYMMSEQPVQNNVFESVASQESRPQFPIDQAMEDLVVSYRDTDAVAPPAGPDTHFNAQPVELSSDDWAEVAHLQYEENMGPEDDEVTEPFDGQDDWSPLSAEDLNAISAAYDDNEPIGASQDETTMPWEACMMSGPLHIPQTTEQSGMAEFAGFARLTPTGELYLFEQADSEVPVGMISLDGCMDTQWPQGACFDLNTLSGLYQGCVGDPDEASDWVHAAKQVACEY